MPLQIGNMRYTVVVKRLTTIKDAYGAEASTYTTHLTLKADLRNRTGSKTIVNQEIFNTATLVFWVHYRDIINTDRIEYKSQMYEILNIAEIGYKEGLELTIALINE